eukprot:747219-Hanusia_phi.AAC.1
MHVAADLFLHSQNSVEGTFKDPAVLECQNTHKVAHWDGKQHTITCTGDEKLDMCGPLEFCALLLSLVSAVL